ncbi:MAG TPA: YceI family protein [Deltaproteobacteria bacterium]|nr:YceI family protein [Deltaproteobacteria bacterium]
MRAMLPTMRSFVALSVLAAATPALAGFTIEGKPKVTFNAEGSPGVLTFEGVTRELSLQDDGTNLVFSVPMDTVETGISLRDEHMRKTYVQTDQFPDAILSVARDQISWPTDGSSEGTVQGRFTVHGVERGVTVTYSIKLTKSGYRVKASFPFDTSSHGVEIPSYLGVTIKPAMEAEVTVDLVDAT